MAVHKPVETAAFMSMPNMVKGCSRTTAKPAIATAMGRRAAAGTQTRCSPAADVFRCETLERRLIGERRSKKINNSQSSTVKGGFLHNGL
jgi:hypothetical protein